MIKLFNCTVLPTYAMTESMPICSPPRFANSGPKFRNTDIDLAGVGPGAGPRVKILRSPEPESDGTRDLTECDVGEAGAICVSGTCVTSGYEFRPHMDEDPNINGFTPDGWLITGDKGYKDADGNVFLVGRFKEIINRNGEKVRMCLFLDTQLVTSLGPHNNAYTCTPRNAYTCAHVSSPLSPSPTAASSSSPSLAPSLAPAPAPLALFYCS